MFISVKKYNNVFLDDSHVHKMLSDFGESNTDQSGVRPDISSARSIIASYSGSPRVGLYDFNDGKDTGDSIAMLLRSKNLDRTEIDSLYERLKSRADELSESDRKKFLDEQMSKSEDELRSELKKFLASSIDSESNTVVPSSGK